MYSESFFLFTAWHVENATTKLVMLSMTCATLTPTVREVENIMAPFAQSVRTSGSVLGILPTPLLRALGTT